MIKKKLLITALLLSALNAQAEAETITVDGLWHKFDVDESASTSGLLEWIDFDGNPLTFNFTLTQEAILDVVDAGFGKDRFFISIQGSIPSPAIVHESSNSVNTYPDSIGLDFDQAFASPDYSKFSITLAPDTYSVIGSLKQSALDETGREINATVGAIRLTAVPLPTAAWLYVTGTALLGFVSRRRQAKV